MPTVTITDEQHAVLDDIRTELESEFIDTYGYVRPQDAIQYLLDTYTPPAERIHSDTATYEIIADAEFPLLQRVAADVDDVPGSGIETATMRGMLLATLGVDEFAARLREHSENTPDPQEQGESQGDATSSDETTTPSSESETPQSESASEPESILSTANRLLDTHSEKWREASGGGEPYEVDLPDGVTATARTKDDVRQLLFKHY